MEIQNKNKKLLKEVKQEFKKLIIEKYNACYPIDTLDGFEVLFKYLNKNCENENNKN